MQNANIKNMVLILFDTFKKGSRINNTLPPN